MSSLISFFLIWDYFLHNSLSQSGHTSFCEKHPRHLDQNCYTLQNFTLKSVYWDFLVPKDEINSIGGKNIPNQ